MCDELCEMQETLMLHDLAPKAQTIVPLDEDDFDIHVFLVRLEFRDFRVCCLVEVEYCKCHVALASFYMDDSV